MTLYVEIELDNAAFEDAGWEEVDRILRNIGERLPDPLRKTNGDYSLHDANGNYVGFAAIREGGSS